MNRPAVSVIIPARGPAKGLEACLAALDHQILPPHEVVVVDNGMDGGPERVRRVMPRCLIVVEKEPGSYAARNAGVRASSGSVLAFTDADCLPDPDWLAQAAGALGRREEASILAGSVEVTAPPPDQRTPAQVLDLKFGFPQETYVRKQGFGVTANLVVPRTIMNTVGPFREDLLSGGDFEWGRRAAAAGFTTSYEGRVRVRHPARKNRHEMEEKERRVTRGVCQLVHAGTYGSGRLLRMALWTLSPPLASGLALLRDSGLGPPTLRLRALTLLVRLRWVRLRTLMSCSEGPSR